MSFLSLQVSFEQTYCALAEKLDKILGKTEGKTFAFAGKRLEPFNTRNILCVNRPWTLNTSTVRGYTISGE